MKYMLIHCAEESRDRSQDASDHAEYVQRTLKSWIAEMGGRGVLLHGDSLRPVSDATTVRVRGEEVLVADGPFAETKEQIGGYDVIECADLDEAIEVAAKHPTAVFGTIEVRPLWVD
jgi:hypothetical protein